VVVDFNLWIWHDLFGLPGGLNDINIWERSPLLKSMLHGTHSEIDHSFVINNETFHQLFYLVDVIYPWLSNFLSTISVPTTVIDTNFLKWQESKRKVIEHDFGILKVNFLCLKHLILMHHRDDIFYDVRACITMHNMMVRILVEEEDVIDDSSFYDTTTAVEMEVAEEEDVDGQENNGSMNNDDNIN
jgi:hypothetical protein